MDKQTKEIFCITQEECAEVTQAISKIFRFGIDTSWNGRTNQERLEEELGDLVAMITILKEANIVRSERVAEAAICKRKKLSQWSSINLDGDLPNA
jgi:NTP pyrophosphatase (non-canonical NTP hydrolase)